MKKHILMGMISIAVLAGSLTSAFAESPWELKKDKKGIQASVREVEGSKILEYKGVVVLDVNQAAAVRLFENDTMTTEWFHECSESRLLKENTPALDSNNPARLRQELDAPVRSDKIFYSVISMPWPVKDRDLVFRRVRSKDPVTGAVVYETSALPEAYPKQRGKIRMPYSKGLWRFTPKGEGRTEMYYQEHSEVGGHIPAWLVNKLAVNIPFNSLSNFRELLALEPNAPVRLRQEPDAPVRSDNP